MAARHPVFALTYDLLAPGMDAAGAGEHRRRLLAGLSGRVVEVGAGPGRNFSWYPPEVRQVVAVEPEPYLRRRALHAAGQSLVSVDVVDGVAEALPVADGWADTVVFALVLCSVADPDRALAEARRVVRPGGALRFYEHVAADSPGWRRAQQIADRVWPRVAGGCHTHRDPVATIRRAGFHVDTLDRFAFPPGRGAGLVSTHVLGSARRDPDGVTGPPGTHATEAGTQVD